jgi:hypothetical protein
MILVGAGGSLVFGGIGVWSGNEKFYQQFLNPFFAKMDPETSHRAAIYVAKYHLIKNHNHSDPDILVSHLVRLCFVFYCVIFYINSLENNGGVLEVA